VAFELVIPFLRPIAHLITDPEVSEIMVNGPRSVFVEREGRLQPVPDVHLDERNLRAAVRNIARALGDDISEEQPILDARLADGSRVAAVFPPAASARPRSRSGSFSSASSQPRNWCGWA
jgi:pilus assembly protein CpaF